MSIYAVNGKTPIAAWVPTRPQNATDVIVSNDGTLTNGASVVSATGEGGSHAFDLDGVNDFVSCGTGFGNFTTSTPLAACARVKTTKGTSNII